MKDLNVKEFFEDDEGAINVFLNSVRCGDSVFEALEEAVGYALVGYDGKDDEGSWAYTAAEEILNGGYNSIDEIQHDYDEACEEQRRMEESYTKEEE